MNAPAMGHVPPDLSSNSPLFAARDEFEFNLAFSLKEAPTFGRASSQPARFLSNFPAYLPLWGR